MSTPDPRRTRLIADIAEANGCRPVWSMSLIGWAWCCTCEDGTHCADQQCSAISLQSAKRSVSAKPAAKGRSRR